MHWARMHTSSPRSLTGGPSSPGGVGLENFRAEKPWPLVEPGPPDHDAPRPVLAKILGPRQIAQLREAREADAGELVDTLLDRPDGVILNSTAWRISPGHTRMGGPRPGPPGPRPVRARWLRLRHTPLRRPACRARRCPLRSWKSLPVATGGGRHRTGTCLHGHQCYAPGGKPRRPAGNKPGAARLSEYPPATLP